MPSNDAATVQIVHTLSAVARSGAAIDLVLRPRSGWEDSPAELRRAFHEHYHDDCGFGIRAIRSRSRIKPVANVLHALAGARLSRDGGYDLVQTRDLEAALPSLALGQRVLFESYRPPTSRERVRRSLLRTLGHRRGLLGLVTHSQYTERLFVQDGMPPERVRTIHNGVDLTAYTPLRTTAEAKAAAGLTEAPTVVYAGRIAPWKGIDLLLAAARRTPHINWVFAGDVDSAEAATLVKEGQTLTNVSFTGYLTGSALALTLQAANVLVVPPSRRPLFDSGRTVLPLKLFRYLAAGRPIIAGDLPDTRELLDETNSVRIPPDDETALAHAVQELVANPNRAARLGRAARSLAETLTWDARANRLIDFIEERLSSTP